MGHTLRLSSEPHLSHPNTINPSIVPAGFLPNHQEATRTWEITQALEALCREPKTMTTSVCFTIAPYTDSMCALTRPYGDRAIEVKLIIKSKGGGEF